MFFLPPILAEIAVAAHTGITAHTLYTLTKNKD